MLCPVGGGVGYDYSYIHSQRRCRRCGRQLRLKTLHDQEGGMIDAWWAVEQPGTPTVFDVRENAPFIVMVALLALFAVAGMMGWLD